MWDDALRTLREVNNGAMPDVASIFEPTNAHGEGGATGTTFPVTPARVTACRLAPRTDPSVALRYDQLRDLEEFVLFIPAGTPFVENSRADVVGAWGTKSVTMLVMEGPRTFEAVRKVLCRSA